MKAVIQRVKNAKVTVNGENICSIDQGICAFVGMCQHDSLKDIEQLCHKILSMKLFDHTNGTRWENNVVTKNLEVLIISQFTLYATWKGQKPNFHLAMSGDRSKDFYEMFVDRIKSLYRADLVKDGKFEEHMEVSVVNDGPMSFIIESSAFKEGLRREKNAQAAKSSET